MSVKYQVSAITGEYEDREGNTKKRYCNMGVVVETRNGGLMMILESIPVNWDGTAFLNAPRDKDEKPQGKRQSSRQDDDSSIPF